MLRDLILKNRSYRRFDEGFKIDMDILCELVDLARLSGSGANLQPLKYMLSNEPENNEKIFEHLAWAGYLKEWPEPEHGERPSAYIIILNDERIRKGASCDHGIAAQSILLGAVEKGLGGCMIGSIKRDQLRDTLSIPGEYEILLVIALGKPVETIVLDEMDESGSIKYWRDDGGVHHVPKRKLDDIIVTSNERRQK